MTMPAFLMALIMLYILAFKFNMQELGRSIRPIMADQPMSLGQVLEPDPAHLARHRRRHLGGLAYNMRVMRANLLDTLNAQYVETARAKGMSQCRRDPETCRAQCAASPGRLPGRRSCPTC